jgi:uncharacterized membrane protein
MNRGKLHFMVQMAILIAIEVIFCFTPLGSLPLGPGIVATLAHIPAIIAALSLGKKAGAIMGGIMGVCSLIVWTFMTPNPAIAFAFTPFAPGGNIFSFIISVVPRAVFPVITALLFGALKDRIKAVPAATVSAIVGTAVHTLLVLSGIYLSFHKNSVIGGNYLNFMIGWSGINAVMEIIVAAIVAAAAIVPLMKFKATQR